MSTATKTAAIDLRHSVHPSQAEGFDTQALRKNFLIDALFPEDRISCTYLHEDRVMVMTTAPGQAAIGFSPEILDLIRATYLLERREIGIFNIGGPGVVTVDGDAFAMERLDALYIGRGAKSVTFRSDNPEQPAKFYMNSAPAHVVHPTRLFKAAEQSADSLGTQETANRRKLTKVIHPGAAPSCQLVMGYTRMESGSVWNTMPPHVHDRRMEVYLYFDLASDAAVIHLMGRPEATRHIVMRNEQCVVSPPWSIHSGAGTTAYSFIWSMAGENQAFTDMDAVPVATLA
jgi:4-deoxy-L-threo-5-hexosulose-uronate ketol-isomerase